MSMCLQARSALYATANMTGERRLLLATSLGAQAREPTRMLAVQ